MDDDSQSINLKRRRLVKGLAGATPGIFTLYSGNAAALASATQRCIINDRARFNGSAVRASDDFFTDEWQRGTLSELAIQVKNGSETKWLAGIPDTSGTLHWYEVEISGSGGATWNQNDQVRQGYLADMLGRTYTLSIENSGGQLTIANTAELPPGQYFLRLETDEAAYLARVTIISD